MDIDRNMLEKIIREIISEEQSKAEPDRRKLDPSGVISVTPRDIELEPFPFPAKSTGVVALKDLFTVEESPRLGAGIMELSNKGSLEWTLTYDEIDYVLEGQLDIITDGRKVSAGPGELILIPKNTSITFSTPDKARFLYVVYPADWFNQ